MKETKRQRKREKKPTVKETERDRDREERKEADSERDRVTDRDRQRERKEVDSERDRETETEKEIKEVSQVKDVFVSRPLAHYKANVREEMEKCTLQRFVRTNWHCHGTRARNVYMVFCLLCFFYSSFACSSSSEPHRKIIKIDKKTGRKEGGDKIRKRGKRKC